MEAEFGLFGGGRGALGGAAADQAVSGAAQLPAGELPAVLAVRHHLVGQLLRHPGDSARPHGAARHHAAFTRHHVRYSQVIVINNLVYNWYYNLLAALYFCVKCSNIKYQ